jgi:hypothetical protein
MEIDGLGPIGTTRPPHSATEVQARAGWSFPDRSDDASMRGRCSTEPGGQSKGHSPCEGLWRVFRWGTGTHSDERVDVEHVGLEGGKRQLRRSVGTSNGEPLGRVLGARSSEWHVIWTALTARSVRCGSGSPSARGENAPPTLLDARSLS